MRLGRGSVVVVTGASAGIGRAAARAFGRLGCRVGLIARGQDGLAAAADEIRREGGVALVMPCDVADADAVDQAAERAERELGPIAVWVNAAMVSVFGAVHQMEAAEFRRVTEVTYLGYVHGTIAALRHMRGRRRGTIVQVGSSLAYRGIPLQSAYCAAKHAIRGFTDSLRCELLHEGMPIRLTMVQLPAVNTPQFDWNRNLMQRRARPVAPVYTPETAARAIVDAARRAPRELWVGASTLQVVLGNGVAPGLMDELLARRAYDGQMTGEPTDPDRPDNLYHALPGDWGPRGRFGDESRDGAWSFDQSTVPGLSLVAAAGLSLAAFGLGIAGRSAARLLPGR